MAISFMRKWFVAIAISILFTSACAQAQSGKSEYQPQVGQEGKDVIWVPTPQSLVDKMLDMGKVTAKDYVIDLGSGDGRTVITAAKLQRRSPGWEYIHTHFGVGYRFDPKPLDAEAAQAPIGPAETAAPESTDETRAPAEPPAPEPTAR